jgi:hypothetical protein
MKNHPGWRTRSLPKTERLLSLPGITRAGSMGLISAVTAFEGGKWAPQRKVKVVKK